MHYSGEDPMRQENGRFVQAGGKIGWSVICFLINNNRTIELTQEFQLIFLAVRAKIKLFTLNILVVLSAVASCCF